MIRQGDTLRCVNCNHQAVVEGELLRRIRTVVSDTGRVMEDYRYRIICSQCRVRGGGNVDVVRPDRTVRLGTPANTSERDYRAIMEKVSGGREALFIDSMKAYYMSRDIEDLEALWERTEEANLLPAEVLLIRHAIRVKKGLDKIPEAPQGVVYK